MQLKKYFALAILVTASTITDSSESQAGVTISIPNVTVAPGSSGFIDVLISSDATLFADADSLQYYFLEFTVSGDAQAAAPINFVPSSIPAPQLFSMEPDYIFLDDSLEANPLDGGFGIDFVGNIAGLTSGPNDSIVVTDETYSGSDRSIFDSDGSFLLARLNFVAPTNATVGNVYDVSVDLTLSQIADARGVVQAFTSSAGTITIGAMAVPEPSSLGLLALCSLAWSARRPRRRN